MGTIVFTYKDCFVYKISSRAGSTGHTNAVTCLQLHGYSTDIKLISGSRDRTVRLWKVENTKSTCLAVLRGHNELVHYVYMDSERLYSSDDDGDLIIWDLEKCKRGDTDNGIIRRFNYEEERG